ncbi:hypothetical protein M408DRAFT_5783 [Serendipita vermifera MAFF 305830]|uniref:G-patch domain-containing protein n=1 Tax=Serendipita vermifera MAFF 305830 TaxID=933852 RepID=A0A0C3BM80_SERVB|nr:hypothetical protein M408DRAFT_5783 [Serendipita vermifera MAFF 305830]
MSDEEDDYLSEKFLQQITSKAQSSSSKTYAERRREAQRQAEIKNIAGRTKSRKDIEKEALETLKEGMNTSLFEKEKLAAAEGGTQSKAMKMMSKMGFKPGQTLGRQDETPSVSTLGNESSSSRQGPRSTPIAINLWEGRKGLGAMKRPLSPDSATNELQRAAKQAKRGDQESEEDYRSRNRLEYEERRDEGRLISAQKTCADLDGKSGVMFNYLFINPNLPRLFPAGLWDQLDFDAPEDVDDTYRSGPRKQRRKDNLERLNDEETIDESSLAARLRKDMKRDALSSNRHDYEDEQLGFNTGKRTGAVETEETAITVTAEEVNQVKGFLQQPVRERLQQVLDYLRERHYFCFWCGAKYQSKEDMETSCPGKTEEDHD